jgi:hypothetical protein
MPLTVVAQLWDWRLLVKVQTRSPITGLCLVATFCGFPNKLSTIQSSEAISAPARFEGDRGKNMHQGVT